METYKILGKSGEVKNIRILKSQQRQNISVKDRTILNQRIRDYKLAEFIQITNEQIKLVLDDIFELLSVMNNYLDSCQLIGELPEFDPEFEVKVILNSIILDNHNYENNQIYNKIEEYFRVLNLIYNPKTLRGIEKIIYKYVDDYLMRMNTLNILLQQINSKFKAQDHIPLIELLIANSTLE